MGDVTTTFTADDKQIEKVYEKLKRLDLELIERQRKLHAQTKEGADAFSKWGEEQARFVKGLPAMAVGFVSIEGAITSIGDSLSEWKNKIREATAESRQFSRELAKAAGLSGDLMNADAIKERFKQSAQGGVSFATSQALRGGIRSGGPSLNAAAVDAMYERAKHLAQFSDPAALGTRAGALAEWSGMSADQSVGAAAGLAEVAGGRADEIASPEILRSLDMLVSAGVVGSRDEALGLGATVGAKVSPRFLKQMAAKLSEHLVRRRPSAGTPFSQVDVAYNRLVGMTPAQRFAAVQKDPLAREALFGGEGLQLANVDWSAMGANTNAIRDAEAPGGIDRIMARAASQETIRGAIRDDSQRAYKDIGSENLARQTTRGDVDTFLENTLTNRGYGWFSKWFKQSAWTSPFREGVRVTAGIDPETYMGEVLGGRGLHPSEFQHFYTDVMPQGIGTPGYAETERASRAEFPEEWKDIPEHPNFLRLIGIMDKVEQNTRPTPQPVVPGGHTDSR